MSVNLEKTKAAIDSLLAAYRPAEPLGQGGRMQVRDQKIAFSAAIHS